MSEKKSLTNNYYLYYSIMCVLAIVGLFFHLYKLGSWPNALNVDEAGLWYNIKCLLNFGTDQKGNSWPLLLANMWGEQSPAYTYLALICCKIFGESLFAIRLPAVINTLLVLIFGYKTVDILFKNKKINLLFVVLYTITPYFTIISKMALDCNLMLGFSTVFLYFFFKALETAKLKWFLFAGIACGLTFYTYALSYLMIPIFLIFALIYLICYKKISIKEVLVFCLPAVLLGLPLLVVQLINICNLEEFALFGITFTKFDSVRTGEFGFSVSNILFNLVCSVVYIFKGFNGSIYNIPCGYLLYPTSILIVLGWVLMVKNFVVSIKTKSFDYLNFILFWAAAIVLATSLLNGGRDVYQQCAIYFVYVVFVIYSMIKIYEKLNAKKIKHIFVGIVALIYFVSFALFSHFYFVNYDEYASETKLMADVVPEELNELDGTTYFLKHYVYYQATYCIPPAEFQANDDEPFVYNDIIFNFYLLEDTPIDETCNYVIYYKDFEKMGYLEKYDFEIEQIGNYLFYKTKK